MRSIFAVINVLGSLLALFAAFYVLPVVTAVIYGETTELWIYLQCAGLTLGIGLAMLLVTRHRRVELKPRDGYLLVSLSWLFVTAAAALPLTQGEPHLSFTDAYFEAMSGLSTTGATVIGGVENLPHAVNLWRHALQWLGGMGIIVLAVAILPLLGVGGMQMYRAETPGTVKDARLTPRITETAKALWLVYTGISAACIGALVLAGMSPFDAICHAFSAMSLGGFSTHDASVAYFHSQSIEIVLMIFMVIAAVNFSTHFVAFRRGDLGAYRRDPKARWVIIWLAVSIAVLTAVVHHAGVYSNFGDALRNVAFMTISMATTTGFVTADYSSWPIFAPMWMLLLTCVIPCTGSTGGGIKMFRALILIKQFFREIFVLVHPQAVAPLRIGGQVIPSRIAFSVLAFIFVYFMSIVVMTFALLLTGMDFVSAFTAVVSSINNTGPGLGVIGPANNYSSLGDAQTWICTLAMFLGRVELFTFLVLFSRTFWRK